MKYVKIKAKNYNEALLQLRMQYGDDAIPISHKYIKEGGFLNSKLFAKDMVELTAGIQEKKIFSRPKPQKSIIDIKVDRDESKNLFSSAKNEFKSKPGGALDQIRQMTSMNAANKKDDAEVSNKFDYEKKAEKDNSSLNKPVVEISKDEYKSLLKFEKDFHDIKDTLDKLLKAQSKPGVIDEIIGKEYPGELSVYEDLLIKNDFDRKECDGILTRIQNSISNEDLKDKYKIEKSLKDFLKSKIVTSGPVKNSNNKKKVIMFVGPTGVGKTTSLAKIGANFALKEGKKVAFVTVDTYRIAATEQLKKYAEIMRIPIEVVNDRKNFKKVIDNLNAEIILVDTSGRSHKNAMKISEIKGYADIIDCELEKILCLSATTKSEDLKTIVKSFEVLKYDNIMITKVDETSFLGNVVGIADKYNKPISYLTNGQEVPNDILVADPDKIVDMMIYSNE